MWKKIREEKQQKAALSKMIGTGKVTVPGGENAELGMSVAPTEREATRPDVLRAMFGVKGMEDEAAKDYLYRPPPDPTSLIQPQPGTPARVVNRNTATFKDLPGTEGPADPLAELKRKNLETTIESRETRDKLARERENRLRQARMMTLPQLTLLRDRATRQIKMVQDSVDMTEEQKAIMIEPLRRELSVYSAEIVKKNKERSASQSPSPSANPGSG